MMNRRGDSRKLRKIVLSLSNQSERTLARLRDDGLPATFSESDLVELGLMSLLGDSPDSSIIPRLMDDELERRKKRMRAEMSVLEKARQDFEEMQRYYAEYLAAEETVERALTKTLDQIEEMMRLIREGAGGDSRGN